MKAEEVEKIMAEVAKAMPAAKRAEKALMELAEAMRLFCVVSLTAQLYYKIDCSKIKRSISVWHGTNIL